MTLFDSEWMKNTKNYISRDEHVQQYLFIFTSIQHLVFHWPDYIRYSVRECVQFGYLYEGDVEVKGNEDCLYLSVYTPKNATKGN